MYIKAISLDGFKSYAQRTEVTGFDPLFNAITGLNGSGKSNILDGICFVLGITNLSQVRATNLQELVYKTGQAGITKATVSIIFDNTNKKQSPMGYEMYDEITVTRQVVVGGRNKYLINGCNATNTRVQDLFRSVQLNVNNPHFLIMQGRITKVLNMKPPEILSMIEEAAGTRLYESKKEAAQKTIEKKDAKLKEIDAILNEEITPSLSKLKEERSSYLEYQKIVRELEHLNKLYIAYKYVCAEEQRQASMQELADIQKSIDATKIGQIEKEKQMKQLEAKVTELEKKRDKEAGGTLEKLEADASAKQKLHGKAQSDCRSVLECKKSDNDELKRLDKLYSKDVASKKESEKKLESLAKELESLRAQSEADEKEHKLAQQHLQEVNAGLMRNEDGAYASLNDQLMAAKKDISQSETEIKQAQMSISNAQQKLKEKSDSLKKTEMNYKKDEAVYDAAKKLLAKLEVDIAALRYEEGREEKLLSDKKQLSREVQNLQERLDKLEARFPQLQFDYKDPEPGFNRKSVHGLVARLITVKEPSTATALEVSAGGKLYNVVVDSEVCGKLLLEKGELKRRVTIIPLNKISSNSIGKEVVSRAEALVGKENVHTALSLVGFKSELQAAMEFVFGNSFVCKDMDTAKKVTFDDKVNKKSVTLDGDSFDPAGTLTGGARVQTNSVLLSLTELNDASNALDQAQRKLQQVNQELDSIKNTAAKWRELKQQYDLKSQEIELLSSKLKQSSHGQQLDEINQLQQTIDEQDAILKKATEVKKKATKKVAEVEDKLKNSAAVKEKEMKLAEREVEQAKKKYDQSIKKTKDVEKDAEQIKLELQDMAKELKNSEDQIAALKDKIATYDKQLEKLNEAADLAKAQMKEAVDKLNAQKELLKGCSKEINEIHSERSRLAKDCNNAQLQLQDLEHKVSKCQKDSKDAVRLVDQMLSDHSWIAEEKKFFGQANTAYDFKTNDPKEAGRRIQKLQETKDKLSKNVNMRAMNMLGKAEEQYNDLMKKRKIVLSDKAKIASVIAELDEKKNEALRKAYDQVNKDFGSIFSTLLPGAKAKLMAPEGMNILDGLEFKVAFGDVWKESLSELSGGQRSLVALSLILSLLLFNPAPLYILDEVDAALDLSHTQNIGQMLKTHFRHSQFIVVSLKDGMFSNANVLFKTKFVDGVSSVTRHVQRQ